MNDDLLQERLARLEAGESLETVLTDLTDETAELVRMAATLRTLPSPARTVASVKRQRASLINSIRGGKTMPDHARPSKRWIWTGAALAGAIGVAVICAFIVLGGGALWYWSNSGGGISSILKGNAARSPLAVPLTSTQKAPEPRIAILSAARGLVEIQAGDGAWEAVRAGEKVAAGQSIRTGTLSGATLTFYDGSHVTLGPGTEVLVSMLDAQKDGVRIIQLSQIVGGTDHVVAHSDNPESLYEVLARSGSGRAMGTTFHVSVSSTEVISFTVTEGAVAVTNAEETVLVSEGQITTFDAGQPPAPPASYFSGEGEVTVIGQFWYIAGQTLLSGPATVIEGDPRVGDWVSFEGRILPAGVRVADRITLIHRSAVDTYSFVGTVNMIGATEWVISGRTVAVDDQTEIETGIKDNDQVEVSGDITDEGVFLAGQIRRYTETAGMAFTFTGVVEQMAPEGWVISNLSVGTFDGTIIDPEIVLNDVVRVSGQILTDGTWQAESIEKVAETGAFNFAGVVIDTEPWNVSGVPFEVDENTQIDDTIRTGNRVRVQGVVLPDGSWLAESITQYDEGQRHAIHFAARVDSIDPWTIGGSDVTVDGKTQITGEIEVGDLVSVSGNLLPDGSVIANKISLIAKETGCTLTEGTVTGFDGETLTLLDGQVIPLTPSITVNGELNAEAVIAIEACPGEDSQPVIASITVLAQTGEQEPAPGESSEQVTICHVTGGETPKHMTLRVGKDAVAAHLAHGDTLGACP